MFWTLKYRLFYKKLAVVTLYKDIHISSALFARGRINKKLRSIPYEPGLRHREKSFKEDAESHEELHYELESEHGLGEDINFMNIGKAYDMHFSEQKILKSKIQQKITASKFFAPRCQPLTLTWNERQCIKYLHKEDPVQWSIKSLSENFPATPEAIKKVLKSKVKISPERAKLLDLRVQKNWELLAEGMLDADPHVLEHLKRFVNRRKILLEQMNNTNFCLPEIKKEPTWNQGEMSNILAKYEKDLEKMTKGDQPSQNYKTLKGGQFEEEKIKKEEKSSLDLIHEEIEMKSQKNPELKDSFLLGEMFSTFKKHTTLEEFENELLKKADKQKKLALTEKALLESKLKVNNTNTLNLNISESPKILQNHKSKTSNKFNKDRNIWKNAEVPSIKVPDDYRNDDIESELVKSGNYAYEHSNDHVYDERTHFFKEVDVGKLLSKVESNHKNQETSVTKITTEEKPRIDFSDPERLRRESEYYDKEVTHIKNTAFWNNMKHSKEKAMAENEKLPHEGPSDLEFKIKTKSAAFSPADYPERIKIPKNKRGLGLTFKVKDCYYDDNGEFLYRVPGMIK